MVTSYLPRTMSSLTSRTCRSHVDAEISKSDNANAEMSTSPEAPPVAGWRADPSTPNASNAIRTKVLAEIGSLSPKQPQAIPLLRLRFTATATAKLPSINRVRMAAIRAMGVNNARPSPISMNGKECPPDPCCCARHHPV